MLFQQGHSIAGGCAYSIASDYRIMADDYQTGLTIAKMVRWILLRIVLLICSVMMAIYVEKMEGIHHIYYDPLH